METKKQAPTLEGSRAEHVMAKMSYALKTADYVTLQQAQTELQSFIQSMQQLDELNAKIPITSV